MTLPKQKQANIKSFTLELTFDRSEYDQTLLLDDDDSCNILAKTIEFAEIMTRYKFRSMIEKSETTREITFIVDFEVKTRFIADEDALNEIVADLQSAPHIFSLRLIHYQKRG